MPANVHQVTSTGRISRTAAGSPDAKERERNLVEIVTRLHRSILRLAFSFHGQNSDLDGKLTDLAKHVRAGQRDAISASIDDVISAILALDIGAKKAPAKPPSPTASVDQHHSIAHLLRHIVSPQPLASDLERFKQQLEAASAKADQLAALDAMAASISDALNHSNSVAQTRLRCETLIELIEEVSFPAELNPQVKAAKKRLFRQHRLRTTGLCGTCGC